MASSACNAFIDVFFITHQAPLVHQALGIGEDQTNQPGPSGTLQTPTSVITCEGRVKDKGGASAECQGH